MKRFLPKSTKNIQVYPEQSRRGFTLIELLVVISIISILAVVGFVVYSGVSARGRDIKRIEELDAIAKAMEKNYQPGTGYVVLGAADFVNGVVPADPLTGNNKCGAANALVCEYCSTGAGTAFGANATCAAANKVAAGGPPAASNLGYTVCANLETSAGAGGNKYYCVKNAQ